MGIYIGIIEKKGYDLSVFFNFKPIAEVQNSQVIQLTPQDQEALLPESEKRNICFNYNWNDDDERRRMDANFSEKSLVLFEFILSDLQPNFKANGDRNQTGYKVSAMEMLDEGKIRPIGNSGVYFAVRKNEIISDFTNDAIVEIDSPCVLAGNQVFIEMDDFWAGPYEVGYREYTSSYYVKPQITVVGLCIIYGKCKSSDQIQSAYDKQLQNQKITPITELLPLMESIANDNHYNNLDVLMRKAFISE